MQDQSNNSFGSYSYFYIMYGIGVWIVKMRMISTGVIRRGVVVFANTYADAQLYIIITHILLCRPRIVCIGLHACKDQGPCNQ